MVKGRSNGGALTALLEDYRRKRARAEVHFNDIEQVVKQFREKEPGLVSGKFDTSTKTYLFEWPRPLPPPGLALVIGDCIYNLRAALDYTMTALVRSTGNEENNTTEFPIYDVPIDTTPFTAVRTRWETDPHGNLARKLAGTPPNTKALIQRLQPFDGSPGMDPDDHPLAILKALSNRDKHRRVNVVVSRVGVTFTDARGKPLFDQPAPHGVVAIPEGTKSNTQIVTLNLHEGFAKPDAEMYLLPAYDIAFDEKRPLLMEEVVPTLTLIREFIDRDLMSVINLLLGRPEA